MVFSLVISLLRQSSHIAGTVEVGLKQFRTESEHKRSGGGSKPYQVVIDTVTIIVGLSRTKIDLCLILCIDYWMEPEVAYHIWIIGILQQFIDGVRRDS